MVKQPEQGLVETGPNENTIIEVLRSLWRRRGVILVALLIGLLIGIAAVASSVSRVPAPVTYYISLTGMEITERDNDGSSGDRRRVSVSYPNGTVFLPRDLLDRQGLQRVKEQLGLAGEVPLNRGISVSFDSPWSEGIIKRYRERLNARGITQADIDLLNHELERDLLTANMSGLRIDVSPVALGVSNDVAAAIAKALPQAWRDVYTERYRTLLAAGLPNLTGSQKEADLSSAAGIVAAQMKIVSMLRGVEMIRNDNRLAGVTNSNAQTANDLESDLRQFRTVRFEPFAASVFASDDPSVAAYRKDLEIRLAATRRDAQAIDRTIQDMLNNPIGKTSLQPSPEGTVQMDGTMLSQVLGLAQRASLTRMMPDMFEKREQAAADIAQLENELLMASVQGASAANPESASAISTELKRLTDEYRDLYSMAFERLRATSSEFYVDLSTPSPPSYGIDTRTMLLMVAPVLLALVVAIGYLLSLGFITRGSSRP